MFSNILMIGLLKLKKYLHYLRFLKSIEEVCDQTQDNRMIVYHDGVMLVIGWWFQAIKILIDQKLIYIDFFDIKDELKKDSYCI